MCDDILSRMKWDGRTGGTEAIDVKSQTRMSAQVTWKGKAKQKPRPQI